MPSTPWGKDLSWLILRMKEAMASGCAYFLMNSEDDTLYSNSHQLKCFIVA